MSAEKRCQHCGHPGRLTPIRNRWVQRIDGYRCTSIQACNDRVRNLGKWTGIRVLRRTDANGTEWTIRRRPNHLPSRFVLTVTYRDQRLSSQHATPEAAKAHVEDLIASMTARDIDAYRDEPAISDDQMELL